ncbi:MAG: 3-hydroxyacyl-ACP dehydratase FabZ family protein [Planctomycetota bacterium]
MRFSQLDRITELTPGESISAVKCLSLAEAYLEDHFPLFPVMPGVMMLESMFQASMYLVRVTDRFRHSMVAMREAKGFKFQGFVQPGDPLDLVAEITAQEDSLWKLKVRGSVRGEIVSSGRLILDAYNMSERQGIDEAIDHYMIREFRLTFRQLCNQLENRELLDLSDVSDECVSQG